LKPTCSVIPCSLEVDATQLAAGIPASKTAKGRLPIVRFERGKEAGQKAGGGDLLAQIAENPKRHKTHKKHAKPSGGVPCGLCIKKQKGTKHTNSGIPFCVFCVFLCY
jgi:hypothetical protein